MHNLPSTGLLRLREILGDKKANPPLPPMIPICRSSWWAGVKAGKYPAPVKLGERTTAWKVADILALIENGAHQ